MNNIKSRQFAKFHENFESMSEKLMSQLALLEELANEASNKEAILNKIEENENLIDMLEKEVRIEFINSILLFTPRAKDLRKIITYQDNTNFLEETGDLLLDVAYLLEKVDFSIDEFDNFLVLLKKISRHAKNMISTALFSFYYEDKMAAYRTISEYDSVEVLYKEINEALVADFQDLSLNEQELVNVYNISNMALLMRRAADMATHIAQSTVYLIEGIDIRHEKEYN